MEADTKNKRGRPRKYGDILYAIFSDEEKRTAQNTYFASKAIMFLQQKPGDFFVTKKGKFRRKGIAEQIGRMYAQDGYPEDQCKRIGEMAMELFNAGYKVKAIEAMIRHGRTTGEW